MTRDIYASMRYRDAPAAIDWLERAFGFKRQVVHNGPDGTVAHAELRYGDGLVMLGHHRHAVEAGAEIAAPPQYPEYGSFYSARDPEGNLWSFGTYAPAP